MHQHHELPRLPSLIPNQHTRSQRSLAHRNAVNKSEVTTPRSLCLIAEVLGTEPKVEFYAVVDAPVALALGCGFAEELPARGAREAVLW